MTTEEATVAAVSRLRDEQAGRILDALDRIGRIDAMGTNCHGDTYVRLDGNVWLGSSVRDALSKMISELG